MPETLRLRTPEICSIRLAGSAASHEGRPEVAAGEVGIQASISKLKSSEEASDRQLETAAVQTCNGGLDKLQDPQQISSQDALPKLPLRTLTVPSGPVASEDDVATDPASPGLLLLHTASETLSLHASEDHQPAGSEAPEAGVDPVPASEGLSVLAECAASQAYATPSPEKGKGCQSAASEALKDAVASTSSPQDLSAEHAASQGDVPPSGEEGEGDQSAALEALEDGVAATSSPQDFTPERAASQTESPPSGGEGEGDQSAAPEASKSGVAATSSPQDVTPERAASQGLAKMEPPTVPIHLDGQESSAKEGLATDSDIARVETAG